MTIGALHRQFGSKARMARTILDMVPADTRIWCEAFCGTCAVTLSADPAFPIEHLNDTNGDVDNLFRVLRDDQQREHLSWLVEFTPYHRLQFDLAQNQRRSGDAVEDARRFLVRSWMAVAGKQGERSGWHVENYNRAASARVGTWRRLPERIEAVARRLKGCYFHSAPAVTLIERLGGFADATLFLDPPYPPHSINTRSAVYSETMDDADHEALAELIAALPARIILTMAPGTIYDRLLRDWRVRPVEVRGMGNRVKTELIFTNFAPAGAA